MKWGQPLQFLVTRKLEIQMDAYGVLAISVLPSVVYGVPIYVRLRHRLP
jgi:hypothetical protein